MSKKFLLSILFLGILGACKSVPDAENKNIAGDRNSCDGKVGWARQDCLNQKSVRWEQIENSAPTRLDLKVQERLTWTHVRKHYKVCRADLCHEEMVIEEDWSWSYFFAREGGIVGVTILIVKLLPLL